MDPEEVDRPGRHVEPAVPEAPNVEQNLADYELKLDGHQSTEVSSPEKVAEREDPAVHDHSGPPLQNLEAEGSDDEAVQLEPDVEESDEVADVQLEPDEVVSSDEEAVVQLEPAVVENSGDEADVGQLEPAGVAGLAEVIVVQQVSTDEESSRPFSMEEPHADEDGAEEPGPLAENVPGQAAIANLRRGVHALEAAAVYFRDAMVALEAGFGIGADDNPAADPA